MRGSYTVGNLPYKIDYNGERNVIAGNTMQMKKNHVNNICDLETFLEKAVS